MQQQPSMPDRIRHIFCALLCAVVFYGVFSYFGAAYAQQAPTVQPTPDTHYTGDLFCPYNYDGLSGRVAHCIRAIIVEAAENFLESFLPFYEAIVLSVMVLAVTLYGALIVLGSVSRPTGQTFIFLFKLGGVAFFTTQFGGMISNVFDIMDGLLAIVTNYVTVSSISACSDEGFLRGFFDLQRPENLTVWDKIDCLMITLLGIGVAQTAAFGMIALLGRLMFTGGVGLIIVLVALFFFGTMLFAVLRALKIYLISVITIAFLICVSPLIIPMLLFSPTRPLFDKWLKNFANYMIIPIFLFAFLSMIVAAYDAILFKGPSSLYYAIASEASQVDGFNFRDWLTFGVAGEVARDDEDRPIFTAGGEPMLESGAVIVGQDVPGLDAIAIMGYIKACNEATGVEREILGDICDRDLDTMLECAISPVVPFTGDSPTIGEGDECTDLEGRPYYGFLRNEEMFHFAIAPNIETDLEARKQRNEGCGWNIFCHAVNVVTKAAGFAFNLVKQIVGAVWQFGGWLAQLLGTAIKAVGSFIEGYCHMGTITPGAICDAAGGAFMVAGSVVHTAGTIVNFGGRVIMNGLLSELGELLDGWFDMDTLDLQKVASYRCKVEERLTDPTDEAYLECPGPEDIVMDIFYVMLTAAVVAYLMLRWLNYIPSLGSTLVGGTRVEASLPGEGKIMRGTSKLMHRMDEMAAKRKGMGKK